MHGDAFETDPAARRDRDLDALVREPVESPQCSGGAEGRHRVGSGRKARGEHLLCPRLRCPTDAVDGRPHDDQSTGRAPMLELLACEHVEGLRQCHKPDLLGRDPGEVAIVHRAQHAGAV